MTSRDQLFKDPLRGGALQHRQFGSSTRAATARRTRPPALQHRASGWTGALLALTLLIASNLSAADTSVTVLSINTDYMWDSTPPHEGQVVGYSRPVPTLDSYWEELMAVVNVIRESDADIVTLVEIEGESVVKDISSELGMPWEYAFVKGRDTYSGQDVAILSRFSLNKESLTDFKKYRGRPFKIVGVKTEVEDQELFLIATHLTSNLRQSNAARRLREAKAIRDAVLDSDVENVIIMGTLNEDPQSDAFVILQGFNDDGPNFINPASTGGLDGAFSSVINGRRRLLDHILFSPSLRDEFERAGASHRTFEVAFSDHRVVAIDLMFEEQ